jgi:hypothetical protein
MRLNSPVHKVPVKAGVGKVLCSAMAISTPKPRVYVRHLWTSRPLPILYHSHHPLQVADTTL